MMSAFFHFQHTLNRLFKVILILDTSFLKYERGGGQVDPLPPGKTTLKKSSLIRVEMAAVTQWVNHCATM